MADLDPALPTQSWLCALPEVGAPAALPPRPPSWLVAALSAGYLPCLERLLRVAMTASQTKRSRMGRMFALQNVTQRTPLVYLLAYGEERQAAAALLTLVKGAAEQVTALSQGFRMPECEGLQERGLHAVLLRAMSDIVTQVGALAWAAAAAAGDELGGDGSGSSDDGEGEGSGAAAAVNSAPMRSGAGAGGVRQPAV